MRTQPQERLSTIVRRVAQLGLGKEERERVLAAIHGDGREEQIRVPRDVMKRLSGTLGRGNGKAVMVYTRKTGAIRVYSLEGYLAMSEACRSNRPWETRDRSKAKAKRAAGKKGVGAVPMPAAP